MKRGVVVDQCTWGAYDLVQQTFPADRRQPLPGVLIFAAEITRDCTMYVPYRHSSLTKEPVRERRTRKGRMFLVRLIRLS